MDIARRAKQISPSLTLEITARAKKMKADNIPVVSFAAGEPDFNTPDYIIQAGHKALELGMTSIRLRRARRSLKPRYAKSSKTITRSNTCRRR